MKKDEKNTLVSVVIVTYNSSITVLETLESVYNQTYNNIELIISDDCSKDSTVGLCADWIKRKQDRFSNVRLLQIDKNTGISANLNRAIQISNGAWIKSLAGDDLLEPTCIEECIKFVESKDAQICMVRLHLFDGNEKQNRESEIFLDDNMYRFLKLKDRKKQYCRVLYKHILPGPGIFYSKKLWEEIGGFDEKYPNFEEYSFELRVLEREKVYFLDKPLVWWRQREGSLTNSTKSIATWEDLLFFKNVRKELLVGNHMFLQLIDASIYYYLVEKIEFNDRSKLYKLLWFFSPLAYWRFVRYTFYKVSCALIYRHDYDK